MTGYKTAGWADYHRTEYDMQVQRALSEVALSPNPDYTGISDAIIRMQEIGDNHAKLRDGQTEYNSYMGENAPNYDADLDWGMSATHDKTGYDERLTTFNNLGLLNYSNGKGDFPNPSYDPSAAEGTAGSFKSMRDLLKSKGVDIQMSNGREVYADEDGQLKPISGSAFDVATEQFSGLWNPTLTAIEDKTAQQSFTSYTDSTGKPIFEKHAATLSRRVVDREDGYSYDEARGILKADVLNYLTPGSPQADRALMASAITAYEKEYEQTWENVQDNESLLTTYGTPWDFFAEEIVKQADLDDPDKPSGGRNQNEQDRRLLAFGSAPVDEPDRQFARELGAEDYDWDEALKMSERGDAILKLSTLEDQVDTDGNFTGVTKRVLKDLGEGVRVHMGQQDIKFDAVPIDNVEVFPDENLAIVYATGDNPGEIGIDIGEEGDPWRYNPLFGGKEGIAPFRVINVLKDDGSGEYTEDYKRLMNQFDRTYGYENALQSKIMSAEEARE